MKYIKLSKFINPVFQTPKDTGSWFGYYNYDPLNHDQTKLLSIRAQHDAELPRKGYLVEVGYYDIDSGEWHKVGMSDSYNWPQGCMAQWMPGKGNENKIIYNTSNGKNNIAVIVDIISLEKKVIDWSIYGITPDGKKAITLVMERSHWCRAYHYESISDPNYDGNIYEEDGIYEVDLELNIRKRIISIQEIIEVDSEKYFDSAKHWLEHIMVSPNGKRFCFLHRYTIGELNDYETRLFIADIDGANLQIIPGWRKYYWSHFGWNGDEAFSIYSYESSIHNIVLDKMSSSKNSNNNCQQPENININNILISSIKKIYHSLPLGLTNQIRYYIKGQKSYYQYYVLKDGQFVLHSLFKKRLFAVDGHPSFTLDGKYMITDTYPLPNQFQRLIIYNIVTQKGIVLGDFYAGLYKKPGTCDLHPKLSRNNNYVVVDSAHDCQHHSMLYTLNWEKIKQVID